MLSHSCVAEGFPRNHRDGVTAQDIHVGNNPPADKRYLAADMDSDSWMQDIAESLPCFRAADVQGDIQKLSDQLRGNELEHQQQTGPLHPLRFASVEVRSRKFRRVVQLADRVAKFDSSVLITGETGVGKEVVGRYIHIRSPRSSAPFVAVNCGALPETLLEMLCSATRPARLPGQRKIGRDYSKRPMAGRSSLTKSATRRRRCK